MTYPKPLSPYEPIFTESAGLYVDHAKQLRAAIDWVRSLGVDLSPTRFGHYLEEMESYAAALASGTPVAHTRRFYAASADGYVLMQAHAALAGRFDAYVMSRIERISGGTDSVHDETARNSAARNIAFELSLAAWLVICGMVLNCDDPADIAGQLGRWYLIVERKRVRSAAQIEKRGKEAAGQLRPRLDNPDHPNMVGGVAFDFTPMLKSGAGADPGRQNGRPILWEHAMRRLQRVINQNARHWRAWKHPRIAAVFSRPHMLGASYGSDAMLYDFILQAMHSLAKPGSHADAFTKDFHRAAPTGAVIGAGIERKFTL